MTKPRFLLVNLLEFYQNIPFAQRDLRKQGERDRACYRIYANIWLNSGLFS